MTWTGNPSPDSVFPKLTIMFLKPAITVLNPNRTTRKLPITNRNLMTTKRKPTLWKCKTDPVIITCQVTKKKTKKRNQKMRMMTKRKRW